MQSQSILFSIYKVKTNVFLRILLSASVGPKLNSRIGIVPLPKLPRAVDKTLFSEFYCSQPLFDSIVSQLILVMIITNFNINRIVEPKGASQLSLFRLRLFTKSLQVCFIKITPNIRVIFVFQGPPQVISVFS